MWYCFACGARGRLDLETETSVDDLRSAVRNLAPKELIVPTYTPEWFETYVTDRGREYWGRRGFRAHERRRFFLGHDEEFPVYGMVDHAGSLLGVIQRPGGRIKYRYPNGVAVHTHLFASRFITGDTVVLAEGAVDAMALWQAGYPAVAQYGATLSLSQVSLLERMGVVTVVLAYDADEAGEYARERSAAELGASFLVRHLRWKGGAKDPAEIPRHLRAGALYLTHR